jgi:hypothetical protein
MVALASLVGVDGCGSDPNSIIGTWRFATSAQSYTLTYAGSSNGGQFTSVESTTDATTGCTSTATVTGDWTLAGDTMTSTSTAGTLDIGGCTNAALDQPSRAATPMEQQTFGPPPAATVTVLINTLTRQCGSCTPTTLIFTRQ